MDPLDALREIARLLERERASKYRAHAFRAAAEALAQIAEPEREHRVRSGKIAGIGDSSRAVILQAFDGGAPDYLAELRRRDQAPASSLRSLLRGDLHSHSNWSDGSVSIGEMVAEARALGHEYLALTDHSPRLRVAHGLDAERLREQLQLVPSFTTESFTLLAGSEVDILADGGLDQSADLLAELDVVVASVHSQLRMDAASMTRRMVRAVASGAVHVLGHVTGQLLSGQRGTRPRSTFNAEAVFAACVQHDVAVEVNSRPERADPPDDLLALAVEMGCLFSINSDAHAPGQLSLLDHGAARAEAMGVAAERVITTWPLPQLRLWLADREVPST